MTWQNFTLPASMNLGYIFFFLPNPVSVQIIVKFVFCGNISNISFKKYVILEMFCASFPFSNQIIFLYPRTIVVSVVFKSTILGKILALQSLKVSSSSKKRIYGKICLFVFEKKNESTYARELVIGNCMYVVYSNLHIL